MRCRRFFGFVLQYRYMNTREISTHFLSETPSVGNLLSSLGRVCSEWFRARMHARVLRKVDFRQLRENEITDETRADVERVRNAPDHDFVNL